MRETFKGRLYGKALFKVFDLHGHITVSRSYASSHATTEDKRRLVAVLHQGPVDSPERALRAAIAKREFHQEGGRYG